MSGQIFISYRRDDASYPAGRLYDRLSAHFLQNQIFIDVDNLEPGTDFVEAIERSVGSCDALIAVIGKRWIVSSDEEGKRRLDNPDDFVRLEIATALKRNIRVIPVFVSFEDDCRRLVAAIEQVIEKVAAVHREREKNEQLEKGRFEKERFEYERLENERLDREQDRPPPQQLARGRVGFFQLLLDFVKSAAELLPKFLESNEIRRIQEPMKGERIDRDTLLTELSSVEFPNKAGHRGFNIPPEPESKSVDCTVFAPDRVEREQSALLQIFLHVPKDRKKAEADAIKFDPETKERGHRSLVLDAPEGTIFAFIVEIEGLEFGEREDTLLLTGKPQAVTFRFDVPKTCRRGQHTGNVRILKDGLPVGKINFQIAVVRDASNARKRPVGKEARHYQACFCSYSSLDRAEMLERAQGLRATGLETFVDVMTLRPGDIWNPKLLAAIDESDLFVVIWSKNARDSKWVKKESRYALKLCEERGTPDFVAGTTSRHRRNGICRSVM
jgi:hypothetical protein